MCGAAGLHVFSGCLWQRPEFQIDQQAAEQRRGQGAQAVRPGRAGPRGRAASLTARCAQQGQRASVEKRRTADPAGNAPEPALPPTTRPRRVAAWQGVPSHPPSERLPKRPTSHASAPAACARRVVRPGAHLVASA